MSLRLPTMLKTFVNPGRQAEVTDARAWKGKID